MGKFISTRTAFLGLVLVFITVTSQAAYAQDAASLKEMIESHYKAINTGEDKFEGMWREAHHHESPLIIPGDH